MQPPDSGNPAGRPALHTTLDLCWHLLGPVTILLMSLWSALFMASLAYLWVTDPAGSWHTVTTQTWILPAFYALSIAPAVLYGLVYRRQTQSIPRRRVALFAHLFIIYGYLVPGRLATWPAGRYRPPRLGQDLPDRRVTVGRGSRLAVPELDWQLVMPPSWEVVEASLDRVAYQDPKRPAFVHVDRVVDHGSLLAGPMAKEVAYWGFGYRRLGLRTVAFKGRPASLWEFLYRSEEYSSTRRSYMSWPAASDTS